MPWDRSARMGSSSVVMVELDRLRSCKGISRFPAVMPCSCAGTWSCTKKNEHMNTPPGVAHGHAAEHPAIPASHYRRTWIVAARHGMDSSTCVIAHVRAPGAWGAGSCNKWYQWMKITPAFLKAATRSNAESLSARYCPYTRAGSNWSKLWMSVQNGWI